MMPEQTRIQTTETYLDQQESGLKEKRKLALPKFTDVVKKQGELIDKGEKIEGISISDFQDAVERNVAIETLLEVIAEQKHQVVFEAQIITYLFDLKMNSPSIEFSNFRTLKADIKVPRDNNRNNYINRVKQVIIMKDAEIDYLDLSLMSEDHIVNLVLDNCAISRLHIHSTSFSESLKNIQLDNCKIGTLAFYNKELPRIEMDNCKIDRLQFERDYKLNYGEFKNSKVYTFIDYFREKFEDRSIFNEPLTFNHGVVMDDFVVHNTRYNNDGTLENFNQGVSSPTQKLKPDVNF